MDILILVTLGTQDKSFTRLLDAVQRQIDLENIKDEVIVQAGVTEYKSRNMKIKKLMPIKKLNKLIEECDLLITHGGVGSILSGLEHNKKVIAAARLKKYDEHESDHQLQIVDKFAEDGYILKLDDFDKLDEISKSERVIIIIETKGYVKEIIKTKRPCYICTYPPIEIVDRIN